jgi:urease subunit beta
VTDGFAPGEIRPGEGTITINEGRETTTVTVANTGDRPVQVGSHFHFFEANTALRYGREAGFGMRLGIPAGTAVRFEPGEERTVDLVAIGGERRVHGMNGLVNGSVDSDPSDALERARKAGFGDTAATSDDEGGSDSETTGESEE